jgi:hypothetical protein
VIGFCSANSGVIDLSVFVQPGVHCGRRKSQGVSIDIDEYRLGPAVVYGITGSDKRERLGQDEVASLDAGQLERHV